jgi:dTDP-4-dehydrorhamnose 3,5-epimerase-like enzyme
MTTEQTFIKDLSLSKIFNDERGFFEAYNQAKFHERIKYEFIQDNQSFSKKEE